jgi:predicted RNase H-like HicB family nuclease
MLTSYLYAAMRHATYKMYKDGSFFATIAGFQGVWAHARTVEECRDELREVLEDWLLLSIADHDLLPVVDGIDLNAKVVA